MGFNRTRRRILQIGVGSVVSVFGGCLGSTPNRHSPTPESTGVTPEPPDEPRTDDLYVNNKDGDDYHVSVQLVRIETDELVLDQEYLLPSLGRFRIPDVGDQGATYSVSAAIDGNDAGTWTWAVDTCVGTEAPRGNRDAEVRIDDGEVELIENVCDAIWVERRPAGNHEAYVVESDGTTEK